MVEQVALPEGQDTFKINEVCKLAKVQPYMLRFWGSEFPQLEAQKSTSGQRVYSRDQVELILEVRRLLFDEGLTVAGAKKRVVTPDKEGLAKRLEERRAAEQAEPEPQPELPLEAAEEPTPVTPAAPVDKTPEVRVQPLLATLRQVRDELSDVVGQLKSTQHAKKKTRVGT